MFQGLSCRVTGETSAVLINHGLEVTNVERVSSPFSIRPLLWAPPYWKFRPRWDFGKEEYGALP